MAIMLFSEAGPSSSSSSVSNVEQDIFDPRSPTTGAATSSAQQRALRRNRTVSTKPGPRRNMDNATSIPAGLAIDTKIKDENDRDSSNPGPSRNPFIAPRSHSAPSLTPWTGTPSKGMKRSWNPATGVEACVKVENRKMEGVLSPVKRSTGVGDTKGKGKGKNTGVGVEVDGVEKGLSDLYISHERSRASQRERNRNAQDPATPAKARSKDSCKKRIDQPLSSGSVNQERPPAGLVAARRRDSEDVRVSALPERQEASSSEEVKRSWRSSIVGGAYNAGVFGAALGLTAYRLITSQGVSSPVQQSHDGLLGPADDDDQSEPHPSSIETEAEVRGPPGPMSQHDALGGEQISLREEIALGRDQTGETETALSDETPRIQEADLNEHADRLSSSSMEAQIDTQRPMEHDLPPPPAYEETVGRSRESTLKSEWEEFDEHLVTPSSSRTATLNHPKHRASNKGLYQLSYPSSSSSLSGSSRRKHKIRPRLSARSIRSLGIYRPLSLSSANSMPTIEIEDQDPSDLAVEIPGGTNETTIHDSERYLNVNLNRNDHQQDGGPQISNIRYEGDVDEQDEMLARLDSMSARLEELIMEGRKALQSPAMPRTGTTPGWEDDENPLRGFTNAAGGASGTSGKTAPVSGHGLAVGTGAIDLTNIATAIRGEADAQVQVQAQADPSMSSSCDRSLVERKSSRRQSRIPTKVSPPSREYATPPAHGHEHGHGSGHTLPLTHAHMRSGRHVKADSSSSEVDKRQSRLEFNTDPASTFAFASPSGYESGCGKSIPSSSVVAAEGGSRTKIPIRSKSMAGGLC
ncbi:hypothetical protein IAU59_000062 [Kwoniella sp. CBS 9459]